MTDEQINVAIEASIHPEPLYFIIKRGLYYRPNGSGYTANPAEAWRLPLTEAKKHEYSPPGFYEETVTIKPCPPRDYCNDLNAMHEAEKVLTPEQEITYVEFLDFLILHDLDDPRHHASELPANDLIYRATARQRAEAYLRTLNLWKE